MRKQILILGLVTTLCSSLYSYTYNIQDGIQEIDSVTDIKDMSVFNGSCVDYVLKHEETSSNYQLHVANSTNYNFGGSSLDKLDSGDKFIVKATGSCSIEIVESLVTVYEDAEDGVTTRWRVYDNDPAGASISNVYDASKQSNVIQLDGNSTLNGYILGHWNGADAWNNTDDTNIRWSLNYNEKYIVYISMQTTEGHRYLNYSSSNSDLGAYKDGYIHHGLGSDTKDGTWRTFSRDLKADLKEYEPNNSIISVNAFLVRGSGKIDDVMMITDSQQEYYNDFSLYTNGTLEMSACDVFTDGENVFTTLDFRSGNCYRNYKVDMKQSGVYYFEYDVIASAGSGYHFVGSGTENVDDIYLQDTTSVKVGWAVDFDKGEVRFYADGKKYITPSLWSNHNVAWSENKYIFDKNKPYIHLGIGSGSSYGGNLIKIADSIIMLDLMRE